jgi:hypothetical protein
MSKSRAKPQRPRGWPQALVIERNSNDVRDLMKKVAKARNAQ